MSAKRLLLCVALLAPSLGWAASPGAPPALPGTGGGGGVAIGNNAGEARDAAAAIAAENAALTAAQNAAAAAAAKPSIGTAAMQARDAAAALAAESSALSTAQAAIPNSALGQANGPAKLDAAGTASGQMVVSTHGMPLTLQQRASMTLNPIEFGATGNGSATAIGNTYGASLAAACGYAAPGSTVHPWQYLCSDDQMGLTFTLALPAAQPAAGATVSLVSPQTAAGAVGWAGYQALFEDATHQYAVLSPGMSVTGPGVPANTTLVAVPQVPYRTQRAIPGATDWAPTATVANGALEMFNFGLWQATQGGSGTTSAGTVYPVNAPATTIAVATNAPSAVVVAPCTFGSAASYNAFNPGGNYPGVWQQGYAGTVCTDGTVQWTLLAPVGYNPVNLGTIVLSNPTTSALPAGTALKFTISNAIWQGLAQDTLGWLGALSNATHASPGGCSGADIDVRGGDYQINYWLFNEANYTNTNCTSPSLSIGARGASTARLTAVFDPGANRCLFAEASVTSNAPQTGTRYHDMSFAGTVVTNVKPAIWGVDNANSGLGNGLCVGESASIDHIEAQGFRGGIGLLDDHQTIHDSTLQNNSYSLLLRNLTPIMGNLGIKDSGLNGSVSSIGVEAGNQLDSATLDNVHTGFSPYGILVLPPPPTMTATGAGGVTASTFKNVWIEDVGQSWIDALNRGVSSDTFTGGGYADIGRTDRMVSNGQGGTMPVLGVVVAGDFTGNVLVNTQWRSFATLTTASSSNLLGIINVMSNGGPGTCGANKIDDYALIFNATATQMAFLCRGGAGANNSGNSFATPLGNGVFRWSSCNNGQVQAGYPVMDFEQYAPLYRDGKAFGGLAAAPQPCSNGYLVPVTTSGSVLYPVPNADPTIAISDGQAVFPTSSVGSGAPTSVGIEGGLDQDGAIGVSVNGCPAGTTLCAITLNPLAMTGATGASTMAAGAGNPAITSRTVDVTSGAGGVSVTHQVPVGKAATICNDTAAAISVTLPSGDTFQGGGSIASIPNNNGLGVCASIRRITATGWHS